MSCVTYYHEGSQTKQQKIVKSKSIEIQPIQKEGEVQADLVLDEVSITTFCGKIYNAKREPVCEQVIKVIKACPNHIEGEFKVVACTKTNKEGKYEVDVYGQDEVCYIIF